jgi:hypothetical protein
VTTRLGRRTVGEWTTESRAEYANAFMDVALEGVFRAPSGAEHRMPGFYDGDGTWRVRFSPPETGRWTYRLVSRPGDPELDREGAFEVAESDARGFLQVAPGRGFGFEYESGDPVFLLGDTVYDLFGFAIAGLDTRSFMERRARQGFNLFRALVPVSTSIARRQSFSEQERSPTESWLAPGTWPWGGSERAPNFGRFNLDYFRVVDRVVQDAEELGVGFELILEGLGYEFPFNTRGIFTAEWEEEWLRYVAARYDAYSSVYFWSPLNEYERYPDGNWLYPEPVFTDRPALCDWWALRIGRWLRANAPHGHVVAVHNAEIDPPFAERFQADPETIGAIMFQAWGTTGADDGWLAAGIEDDVRRSLAGWPGSAVLSEYGYERNPALPVAGSAHLYCDPEHTRRGAWRGAFCRLGVVQGFDNSWGPYALLDEDLPGVEYLAIMRRFFTEVFPFADVAPRTSAHVEGPDAAGRAPLVLETVRGDAIAVYLPAGGDVRVVSPDVSSFESRWFDPRTGALSDTRPEPGDGPRPHDWVLVLRR